MRVDICPICGGTGIYTKVVPCEEGCCKEEVDTQCHGCTGRGWIQIDCKPGDNYNDPCDWLDTEWRGGTSMTEARCTISTCPSCGHMIVSV
jgi:hypothetical protein